MSTPDQHQKVPHKRSAAREPRRRGTTKTSGSTTDLPAALRLSMAREIRRQTRHLTRCVALLKYVDRRTYDAGRDIYVDDAGLVSWLCAPEVALRGVAPLIHMRTEKGRAAVADLLVAIAHGIVR